MYQMQNHIKKLVLRIDYVRSYQNGFQGDGVMFGIQF
jgi:hypothetical protein